MGGDGGAAPSAQRRGSGRRARAATAPGADMNMKAERSWSQEVRNELAVFQFPYSNSPQPALLGAGPYAQADGGKSPNSARMRALLSMQLDAAARQQYVHLDPNGAPVPHQRLSSDVDRTGSVGFGSAVGSTSAISTPPPPPPPTQQELQQQQQQPSTPDEAEDLASTASSTVSFSIAETSAVATPVQGPSGGVGGGPSAFATPPHDHLQLPGQGGGVAGARSRGRSTEQQQPQPQHPPAAGARERDPTTTTTTVTATAAAVDKANAAAAAAAAAATPSNAMLNPHPQLERKMTNASLWCESSVGSMGVFNPPWLSTYYPVQHAGPQGTGSEFDHSSFGHETASVLGSFRMAEGAPVPDRGHLSEQLLQTPDDPSLPLPPPPALSAAAPAPGTQRTSDCEGLAHPQPMKGREDSRDVRTSASAATTVAVGAAFTPSTRRGSEGNGTSSSPSASDNPRQRSFRSATDGSNLSLSSTARTAITQPTCGGVATPGGGVVQRWGDRDHSLAADDSPQPRTPPGRRGGAPQPQHLQPPPPLVRPALEGDPAAAARQSNRARAPTGANRHGLVTRSSPRSTNIDAIEAVSIPQRPLDPHPLDRALAEAAADDDDSDWSPCSPCSPALSSAYDYNTCGSPPTSPGTAADHVGSMGASGFSEAAPPARTHAHARNALQTLPPSRGAPATGQRRRGSGGGGAARKPAAPTPIPNKLRDGSANLRSTDTVPQMPDSFDQRLTGAAAQPATTTTTYPMRHGGERRASGGGTAGPDGVRSPTRGSSGVSGGCDLSATPTVTSPDRASDRAFLDAGAGSGDVSINSGSPVAGDGAGVGDHDGTSPSNGRKKKKSKKKVKVKAPEDHDHGLGDGDDVKCRVRHLLTQYDVSICSYDDLLPLKDYEIVFVADDSGSMSRTCVRRHPRPHGKGLGHHGPRTTRSTRWDELKATVTTVAEFACTLDEDGIDLYFLNRNPVRHIVDIHDRRVASAFRKAPHGTTPLTETLQKVIRDHKGCEKPVLVVVATDGVPDGGIEPFRDTITQAVGLGFRFQVIACTDGDKDVAWLSELDDEWDALDVTRDYSVEAAEYLMHGKVKGFTRADWVIKALLGPINAKVFHPLNGRTTDAETAGGKGGCFAGGGGDGQCCSIM